jgi:transposase
VDHHNQHQPQEVLVVHRNAPLTETGRLRLARCVVKDGWPVRRAAERFQVSHTTAARWAARYRESGAAGMADRSSRPHASPARTARRTEILADEKRETAAGFLARAHAWYAAAGITIERVLTDNGGCYRSKARAAACGDLDITHKRTRPYATETQRREALDPWPHTYNHHRGHTALKGQPPASRVTNLTGQYT